MSAGAPWSVKGIDPKAREIAKDLARRSGMTLGEWLNQMILDDGVEDVGPDADQALSRKPPYIGPERRARPRGGEGVTPETEAALERVSRALEGVTERIETAEQRSSQAIGGVDRAVTGLLSRLEMAERGQTATALRIDRAAAELRADQSRVSERLKKIEQDAAGPRSLQALKALEAAMSKLAGQLYEGDKAQRQTLKALAGRVAELEAAPTADVLVEGLVARISHRLEQAESRTSDAIRALEGSFNHLDRRLNQAEVRLDVGVGPRLDNLAEDLSRKMEAARNELAVGLDAAVNGRFDKIERTLETLSGHVEAAEKRSAEAIEHMGHEVVRIARNLDVRMTGVEQTSQRGLEQTRGDLARLAEAAEQRFRAAESGHANALERLGQEIGRISAQMTERLIEADRRTAAIAEDTGQKLERTAGLLEARWNKASSDLSDMIRQSEERTAKLLEETKARMDQVQTPAAAPVDQLFASPEATPHLHATWNVRQAPTHETDSHDDSDLYEPKQHAAERTGLFDESEADLHADHDEDLHDDEHHDLHDDLLGGLHAESEAGSAHWAPAHADEEDLTRSTLEDDEAFSADTEFLPDIEAPEERPAMTTRQALEAARSAARGGSRNREDHAFGFGLGGLKLSSKTKLSERVAKESKRDTSVAKTAVLSSAVAMILVSSVIGYKLIMTRQASSWALAPSKKPAMGPIKIVEPDTTPGSKTASEEPLTPEELAGQTSAATTANTTQASATTTAKTTPSTPIAAVALSNGAAMPPKATDGDPASLYQQAVHKLAAQEPGGVALLTKAANAGYAPAELRLGQLFADGEAGLAKDPGSARRWTERAANAGEARAMHNLALYYFDGTGGPKDLIEAAGWFRKAAQAGVTDSQYNLARLYEQGYGVQRDPAEAYKWYLVAARAGDKDSKDAATALKPSLSTDEVKRAEQAAAAIRSAAHEETSRLADR